MVRNECGQHMYIRACIYVVMYILSLFTGPVFNDYIGSTLYK